MERIILSFKKCILWLMPFFCAIVLSACTVNKYIPVESVLLDKTSLTITPEEMTSDACKVTFNINNVSQLELSLVK